MERPIEATKTTIDLFHELEKRLGNRRTEQNICKIPVGRHVLRTDASASFSTLNYDETLLNDTVI